MNYNSQLRPAQVTPAFDAFTARRAKVRDGISLSFLHEGVGGYPLLLLHGYPETKRIWWRNIGPLAQAGFEVIAVDLRGMGDSDHPPDDAHDIVTYARDLYELVHNHLGHETCVLAASDVGGVSTAACPARGRAVGAVQPSNENRSRRSAATSWQPPSAATTTAPSGRSA